MGKKKSKQASSNTKHLTEKDPHLLMKILRHNKKAYITQITVYFKEMLTIWMNIKWQVSKK